MRIKAVSALTLAGILSLALFSTVATDNWTSVEFVAGNPSCEGGFKYENPLGGDIVDGSLTVPGGSISIDVTVTADGPIFAFTATGFLVDKVTVKGGPNANNFLYSTPEDSDHHLHSPLNSKSGKWYGLSHLCFYGDEKKTTPPDDPKK